jgi:two-component system chemotaxis response regulator CheY
MARILVVDDNPAIRHIMGSCLPMFGHVVTLAEDGIVALERADALSTDLILLDIDMPRMNGITVCETLKRDPARTHISILMMTGRMSAEVEARARRAGAAVVLDKPFTWERLEQELSRHLPAGV